jgi:UDP-N-acetylglucosamine acyltransferase
MKDFENNDCAINNDFINIDGNFIHKTAIVYPNVKLGKGNIIGAYSVIGSNGEIRGIKQCDFNGYVEIGNNNVISEFVSIQRPSIEGKKTFIGNQNLIMAHSHIGHDASIGSGCEICSGSIIGGYAIIGDGAKIKLGVTIRNRKVIGNFSTIGLGSVVTKDIEPNTIAYGNPARQK